MKNILTFLLLLLSFACSGQVISITAKVIRVLDGDTYIIIAGSNRFKARLAGSDAPESRQHYGKEATDSIAKILLLKDVTVEYDSKLKFDRFGRWIVAIKIGSYYLDSLGVARGWLWYYDKYPSKLQRCTLSSMKSAKAKKLGLWACEYAIQPAIFRTIRYSHRSRFKHCGI